MNAISLPRYAKIIGYTECAFFGVSHPTNDAYNCREIWTKWQRDEIEFYLGEAQDEIENIVGYPLLAKWVEEEVPYECPVLAPHGHIIEAGVKDVVILSSDLLLDHTADPAVTSFTPASTITSANLSNVHIFYPDTDVEIIPSKISIVGTDIAIEIPRCRLVDYDLLENPPEGWDYYELANFQTQIDVVLWQNDASSQATLLWPHQCNSRCSPTGCTEGSQTACEYLANKEIGKILVNPANYSNGSWSVNRSACVSYKPMKMVLRYRAGLPTLSRIAETTIVRLAHSKMPTEPCGCDVTQRLWKRDRHIPDILTRERLECPFGLSDGAWVAWKYAQSIAIMRGDIF